MHTQRDYWPMAKEKSFEGPIECQRVTGRLDLQLSCLVLQDGSVQASHYGLQS